ARLGDVGDGGIGGGLRDEEGGAVGREVRDGSGGCVEECLNRCWWLLVGERVLSVDSREDAGEDQSSYESEHTHRKAPRRWLLSCGFDDTRRTQAAGSTKAFPRSVLAPGAASERKAMKG